MAEREGFEPPVRFHVRRFSRPVHSTTLPPLRRSKFVIASLGGLARLATIRKSIDTVFAKYFIAVIISGVGVLFRVNLSVNYWQTVFAKA